MDYRVERHLTMVTLYENKVNLKHDLISLFVSPGIERLGA